MRRFSHHEMLGLYLIHLSATLTDVFTLCAQHLWMPFPENSPSQTFCWCLEHFLPEACCPHQQGCMEKVVTFLLIRGLGGFLLWKTILSIFCPLLVSQQASPHLVTHCRPHFPRHHCLCCSGLRFQKIKRFPGLYWGEKGCLTCGTGHADAFNSNPLFGHCAYPFFISASHNCGHDGAACFLSYWNNN